MNLAFGQEDVYGGGLGFISFLRISHLCQFCLAAQNDAKSCVCSGLDPILVAPGAFSIQNSGGHC